MEFLLCEKSNYLKANLCVELPTWPGWNAPPTLGPGSRGKSSIRNIRTEEGTALVEGRALGLSATGSKANSTGKLYQDRIETNSHSEAKFAADPRSAHEGRKPKKLACAIRDWITTSGLTAFVDKSSDFLGGMWAVVATVFVFRDTRINSLSAGLARLIATCVSFALCLLYLLLFPFQPLGMAVLIGLGTLVMMLLGRREDMVTTGMTTAVVMVVAAMSPRDTWQQPLLRLIDTIVGIAVGVGSIRIASFLFVRKRAQ
jgi:uncharacterized membrane protein YccC